MKFDLPKDQSSIIKVIGVGGGGGNAVNHMFNQGIKGVDFIVCNTDAQALDVSPVPVKIQLGNSLTEGRGAGSIPEVGKNAAIEDIEDIREILSKNTKMVFVTAGMGGGTGTGAAPIIARVAKEMSILTVGIVTVPFVFEGRKRRLQAEQGLAEMRDAVDTLLVINNDKLRDIHGNLTLANAFAQADDILTIAAKGIAEVISVTGSINVDFNDVNTVMKDSGVAIMGSAQAEGEDRAIKCVEKALTSPLLNDDHIAGAKYVLLNITYGDIEVLMDEIADITDYIQDEAGSTADVIWGHGHDESLGDKLCVTIIATGFNSGPEGGIEQKEPERKVLNLEDDVPTMITQPIGSPTENKKNMFKEVQEEAAPEPYLKTADEVTTELTTEADSKYTEVESVDSVELDITAPTPVNEEKIEDTPPQQETKKYFMLEGEVESTPENKVEATEEEEAPQNQISPEELQRRSSERIARIKEISNRMKTPTGLTDLENEPAYKRRRVNLDNVPHSSENSISRFTLSEENENGEKKTGLRENNSFLHDNVD